jgi:hypothetical protein
MARSGQITRRPLCQDHRGCAGAASRAALSASHAGELLTRECTVRAHAGALIHCASVEYATAKDLASPVALGLELRGGVARFGDEGQGV